MYHFSGSLKPLNRQAAESVAVVFDDDKGSSEEILFSLCQQGEEARVHGGRRLVVEAEENHTRERMGSGGEEVSEVKIEGENHTLIAPSQQENFVVRKPV